MKHKTEKVKPDDLAPEEPDVMLPHFADTQLLAALLEDQSSSLEAASRTAQEMLSQRDALESLSRLFPDELIRQYALTPVQAWRIYAALELGKRLYTRPADERPVIRTARDAARLMRDMADLHQEHVRVILLDTSQRIIAISTVYIGTVNAAVLRTAEIFRDAIAHNAPAIILAHNHPSGDPSPSPEDVQLTGILAEAGKLLDIVLLDHIIIAGSDWRSLKEMRLGF